MLSLDTSQFSVDRAAVGEIASTVVPVAADEALSLRIFIDGLVIEVYASDRVVLTGRQYPTQQLDTRMLLQMKSHVVNSMRIYEMRLAR